MTGDFRSKIIDMLQRDTPGVVQSKIAHELKNRNDGPCPIVPKRTTLKQMKYRENKNQRTLRDESATLSICKMSEEPAYIGCIDAVGAKPFFVYYSTPSQKARTKALSKKNTTKLSIDATGCCAQLPAESETSERTGKKKRCFYYAMTMHGQKGSTSAYQMLSQSHTSQKISEWLTTWKIYHHANKSPRVVIVDESAALLSAVAQTFACKKSMNGYLSQCLEHLENGGEAPECYIRLDRSHVVRTINRNKQFSKVFGQQKSQKHFYLRAIGFLLQQHDWKVVKKIIADTFRLALDPSPNVSTKILESNMIELTKTHKIYCENEAKNEDPKNDLFDARWIAKRSAFYHFIEKIATNVKEEINSLNASSDDDSIEENGRFYSPKIVPTLIEIFSKIPLTSCILNESFELPIDEYPTSSATEANFRVVNRDLFGEKKRFGMDGWIETHLKYLLGKSKAEEMYEDDESTDGEDSEVELNELEYESMSEDDNGSESSSESDSGSGSESLSECLIEKNDKEIEDFESSSQSNEDDVIATKKNGKNLIEDDFDDKLKQDQWMGENDDAKKPLKKFSKRSHFSILNPQNAPLIKIPILKNSHTIKKGQRSVIVTQACAPNSLTHVFFAIYTDSEKIKKEFDALYDPFVTIIKTAINSRKIDTVYKLRADFLVDCYKKYCAEMDDHVKGLIANIKNDKDQIALLETQLIGKFHFPEEDNKIIRLNCDNSLISLLRMLNETTSVFGVKEITMCEVCNIKLKDTKVIPACPLNINLHGTTDVQSCLNDERYVNSHVTCPQCKEYGITKRIPSRILFMDLENLACLSKKTPEERGFPLASVTQQVRYGGKTFFLKAIIEHKIGGHFIAQIQRATDVWQQYDDLQINYSNSPKMVEGSLLVYLMTELDEKDAECKNKATILMFYVSFCSNP